MQTDYLFKILKASIYGGELDLSRDCDYESIFSELQSQTVLTLTKPVLNQLPLSAELHEKWEKAINQQLAKNARVAYEEKQICKLLKEAGVSFVIIKGSAAAQYYPKPELRTRGDIDVLVNNHYFEAAAKILVDNGIFATEVVNPSFKHIHFKTNNVVVELHSRFFEKEEQKNLLYSAMQDIPTDDQIPMLPDILNGLVLLYHIQYHLKYGVGLRQFVDWFMFVNRILSDELWNAEFKEYATDFHMSTLAMAATKLGVKLGLIEREVSWCNEVEDEICNILLEQIMENGNFGNKENEIPYKIVTTVISKTSPVQVLKNMQIKGEITWDLAQKHKILKPLAGIHQAYIYTKQITNRNAIAEIIDQKQKADKRQALLKKLGI